MEELPLKMKRKTEKVPPESLGWGLCFAGELFTSKVNDILKVHHVTDGSILPFFFFFMAE